MRPVSCYDRKLYVCGSVLEFVEFELPVVKPSKVSRVGRAGQSFTTDDVKRLNREKNVSRSRQKVCRYINTNFTASSKFVTLTFAENVTDLRFANRELGKFLKRLKRHFGNILQYIAVVEFQKRGAIHYHVLMNCPYIPADVLERLWGHGFVKINAIDNVDNLGAYFTKYMTKDNMDERLAGQKSYFMSRNLKKPEETTDGELIDEVLAAADVERVAYSTEFESEYYGTIRYTQLVLASPVTLADFRRPPESCCFPPLWGVCVPLRPGKAGSY